MCVQIIHFLLSFVNHFVFVIQAGWRRLDPFSHAEKSNAGFPEFPVAIIVYKCVMCSFSQFGTYVYGFLALLL